MVRTFKVVAALTKSVLHMVAFGRQEWIQQVLTVAGNSREQFAVSISSVTQFCRSLDLRTNVSKQFLSSAEANAHQAGEWRRKSTC